MTEPAGTQLSLVADTTDPAAEETTAFTVTASNAKAHITSITVDYTDDGNWDDTRTVDASSVTEAFTWVYHEAGHFTVRVEVRDATDTLTTATVDVTVASARSVAVSYLLIGTSAEGGACNAYGPPATCSGCAATLGDDFATAARRPLGMRNHGSVVTVSQGFSQGPYANGQDILYACTFSVRLVTGTAPYEIRLGTGSCATTSKVIPTQLNCTGSISGIVP